VIRTSESFKSRSGNVTNAVANVVADAVPKTGRVRVDNSFF